MIKLTQEQKELQAYKLIEIKETDKIECIYFIKNKYTDLIKVGTSKDVYKTLQAMNDTFWETFGKDDANKIIALVLAPFGTDLFFRESNGKFVKDKWMNVTEDYIYQSYFFDNDLTSKIGINYWATFDNCSINEVGNVNSEELSDQLEELEEYNFSELLVDRFVKIRKLNLDNLIIDHPFTLEEKIKLLECFYNEPIEKAFLSEIDSLRELDEFEFIEEMQNCYYHLSKGRYDYEEVAEYVTSSFSNLFHSNLAATPFFEAFLKF